MTKRSRMLDIIRWVAAFLVVVGHVRSIMFIDYDPHITNYFYKAIYFITGFGSEAVMIFFVLSGYLICNSILKQMANDSFNLKNYLVNRFSRIYIVLIPALLLTLFFDYLGYRMDSIGVYHLDNSITSLQPNPISRLSLSYFFGSLLMMQNIIIAPYGSNGPLWSLNYEFWYYLIIPSILGIFYFKKEYNLLIINVFLILLFLHLMPPYILKYGLVWLLGLMPIFLKKRSKGLQYFSVILLVVVLILNRVYKLDFTIDFIIGFLLALFISTLDDNSIVNKQHSIHTKLASFSYTLYLSHYSFSLFLLVAINRFLIPMIKVPMNTDTLFTFLCVLIMIYVFSYMIARITEYKTDNLRALIHRII